MPFCEGLGLTASVRSPDHHFGHLGIYKRACKLLAHALVKLLTVFGDPVSALWIAERLRQEGWCEMSLACNCN
jgi:hypothetical protein